ncbi:hypothetical protein SFRURICE_017157 [Spodoptera frugiperda]|nr:hypothetical protein SFRURICE_017157 [Spodoptera frugiperda]
MDLHAPQLVVHSYEPHAPLLEVEGLDPHSPQQKVLIHAPTLQSQELMSSDHRNGDEQYHAHSSNQSGDGESLQLYLYTVVLLVFFGLKFYVMA